MGLVLDGQSGRTLGPECKRNQGLLKFKRTKNRARVDHAFVSIVLGYHVPLGQEDQLKGTFVSFDQHERLGTIPRTDNAER